jgi:8-amino-7-oxononanoate synthase
MDDLEERLEKKIKDLSAKNMLRSLKNPNSALIDFTSNDYLGLAHSKDLNTLISDRLKSFSLQLNGATGSRLLSGNSSYTEEVEEKLARIFHSESSLIFSSGYTANLSVLSSVPQKGDTIFYDELAHACIKDGARLSLANRFSFRHNDLDDLRNKLKNVSSGISFIVVESIYSMDGDECPLSELIQVSKEFNAKIILDEAHSTGVMGLHGNGLAIAKNLENEIAIRIYTFGKAMGIHGACVAGSKTLVNYIINTARPFMYTTALPLHSITAIDCAFEYLNGNIILQQVLNQKISLFKQHCKINTNSNSPIQPILFSNHDLTKDMAKLLTNEKFDVRPILSPTVKIGTERLRICMHAYNEDEDIIRLAQTLNKAYIDHA